MLLPKENANAPPRVFVVDDELMVLRGVRSLIHLEPALLWCGEALDLPSALEQIALLKPNIAIVDLSLKQSSGLDLIRELRRRGIQIGILVFSMHDEHKYVEDALSAGADGYLTKQEGCELLLPAIRELGSGRRFVSEHAKAALASIGAASRITPARPIIQPV